MLSEPGHYINVHIVKEHGELCRVHAAAADYASGTCVATVRLVEGDDVWVQHIASSGDAIHGDLFATFSGHLIQEEEPNEHVVVG
jgi:hypothetical protein